MRNLIKTSLLISSTEIVLVLVEVVRNKFLATQIGTEGFGIYGLRITFLGVIAIFTNVWLQIGTKKFVAEYNSENKVEINGIFTP